MSADFFTAQYESRSKALFCPECSNLVYFRPTLKERTAGYFECYVCHSKSTPLTKDSSSSAVETTVVFSKLANTSEKETEEYEKTKDDRAEVDEECPKCHYHRVRFTTAQLRSVDEGQTIFYQCLKCKHKWTVHS